MDEQINLGCVDPASGDGLGRASADAGYRDRKPRFAAASGRVGCGLKDETNRQDGSRGTGLEALVAPSGVVLYRMRRTRYLPDAKPKIRLAGRSMAKLGSCFRAKGRQCDQGFMAPAVQSDCAGVPDHRSREEDVLVRKIIAEIDDGGYPAR